MQIMTPLAQELTRYVDLSVLEQKVTAENMANVDTPGYRTMGFDFAAAMRQSVEQMEQVQSARQSRLEAGLGGADGSGQVAPQQQLSDAVAVRQVGGLLERPDGNDVSVDRESLKMAEAQMQFSLGMQLVKDEFTQEMDAIHAAG